jgi:hypothetical protein
VPPRYLVEILKPALVPAQSYRSHAKQHRSTPFENGIVAAKLQTPATPPPHPGRDKQRTQPLACVSPNAGKRVQIQHYNGRRRLNLLLIHDLRR